MKMGVLSKQDSQQERLHHDFQVVSKSPLKPLQLRPSQICPRGAEVVPELDTRFSREFVRGHTPWEETPQSRDRSQIPIALCGKQSRLDEVHPVLSPKEPPNIVFPRRIGPLSLWHPKARDTERASLDCLGCGLF
jgi:hypothetical protein